MQSAIHILYIYTCWQTTKKIIYWCLQVHKKSRWRYFGRDRSVSELFQPDSLGKTENKICILEVEECSYKYLWENKKQDWEEGEQFSFRWFYEELWNSYKSSKLFSIEAQRESELPQRIVSGGWLLLIRVC